jgi:hypothetical protein
MNAPDRQSTFGHRPRAHHAGAAVLARSNGGDTVNDLVDVSDTVATLRRVTSSMLPVD